MPPSYLANLSGCFQLIECLSGMGQRQLFKILIPPELDQEYEGVVTNRVVDGHSGHPVIAGTMEYYAPSQQELLLAGSVVFLHAGFIDRGAYPPGAGIAGPSGTAVPSQPIDGLIKLHIKCFRASVFPGNPDDVFYATRLPEPIPPFANFVGLTGHSYDPQPATEYNLRYFDVRTTVYDQGAPGTETFTSFTIRVFIPIGPRWARTTAPQPNSTVQICGKIIGVVPASPPTNDNKLAVLLDGLAFVNAARAGNGGRTDPPSSQGGVPPSTPRRRGWMTRGALPVTPGAQASGSRSAADSEQASGSSTSSSSFLFGNRSGSGSSSGQQGDNPFDA
ncbi:hypothetical protein BJ508DRAFT_321505 [Ascobolus immersus RN42]|uniref:Uncharacterized protein n=1 Tax=Ascobolus immersus RN42 TaxID=1160509 RepID=A0A3N4IRU6_ASCIM|nr:hypothetical protein BJ508DRAFT_321505 [Ascobolus immersus RN42]